MAKLKSKPEKTVALSELSTIKMSTGGSKKHPVVIHEGKLKRWVGIGWVAERTPTKKDREKYPTAI